MDADSQAVHPHACGEKTSPSAWSASPIGSSPRVWGKAPASAVFSLNGRFIPTRVGKRDDLIGDFSCSAVHPHACGEKGSEQCIQSLHVGSSPRVWGKVLDKDRARRPTRFIPTRVGKSGAWLICLLQTPVHPHACGEKGRPYFRRRVTPGSSPRVWGKGGRERMPQHVGRFIPTRVGKRPFCASPSRRTTVHRYVVWLTRYKAPEDRGTS